MCDGNLNQIALIAVNAVRFTTSEPDRTGFSNHYDLGW